MPALRRCYERGDLAAANQIYADLHRFNRFVEQWPGARWQKMALKVFKLPGGEGGLRKPYLMPSDAEVERFTTGLLALGLAEIDELARAAGLCRNRPSCAAVRWSAEHWVQLVSTIETLVGNTCCAPIAVVYRVTIRVEDLRRNQRRSVAIKFPVTGVL